MRRKISIFAILLVFVFCLNACTHEKEVEHRENVESETEKQEEFLTEEIEEGEVFVDESEDITLYEDEYLFDDMENLEEDEILP